MEKATYYSPAGNPEVWRVGGQPDGYSTEAEWLAAHPPEVSEPDPEAERQARIAAIRVELRELDMASIRPLRAIENGADVVEDHARLVDIRKQTEALRAEMRELEGNNG